MVRRSIIVGEVFTKALRRKDMAGSSTVEEVEEEGAEKKEVTDEELEKASSGKILNLISVDTFRRESFSFTARQGRR